VYNHTHVLGLSLVPIERNSRVIIDRLKRDGWIEAGGKGSHRKFRNPVTGQSLVVPHPKKDLPTGTAQKIAKQAGWPKD
jgi:predicted RNA binding protein YcfA (HicA-like mRNA interferase family)